MQSYYRLPVWKTAPFLRLLLPLIAGILLQLYTGFGIMFLLSSSTAMLIAAISFLFLPVALRYRFFALQGILLNLFTCFFGMLICWQKDVRHHTDWYGHTLLHGDAFIITINEPPVKKDRTWKAAASIETIIHEGQQLHTKGKLLLYFSRTNDSRPAQYGDRLLLRNTLVPISNSGNPGAFDYRQYAAFQQLFHTIFLKPGNYVRLEAHRKSFLSAFIFSAREKILAVIKENVQGDPAITGIAEALLIGYKEDLDKDLVQAYSNTGVVHIIAISGLHLGLIYLILTWIFNRMPFINKSRLIKVCCILLLLWLFSLLTGASASVLRSAVMFTCIIIGKNFFIQGSIYNSLAASAFILLCYNPFFLWDVGFQLSYLALLGIVWLQKPIEHLLYLKWKWAAKIWQLVSVTIAAQLLTFPVCIYYFHQFPNIFLLTNLVTVPLSTLILCVELALLVVFRITPLAWVAGKLVYVLIWLMNHFIDWCNRLPYAVTDIVHVSPATCLLLYVLIAGYSRWLLYRESIMLKTGYISATACLLLYMISYYNTQHQRKIIIYHVAHHQAIDFINRDAYTFTGDTVLQEDKMQQNFYLKPTRNYFHLTKKLSAIYGLNGHYPLYTFSGKTLLVADSGFRYLPANKKISIDILVISHNPHADIESICNVVKPRIIVFDGSNSLWKIAEWKKQCEQLLLPCFSIPEQGAFVSDL